eukprot:bmy_15808T0
MTHRKGRAQTSEAPGHLGTYVILIGTKIWNHGNIFPVKCIEQAKTAMQFMPSGELCRHQVNECDLP